METSKIKSLSEYTLLTKELIDRVYTSNRTTYPWFRGHRNSDWLISPSINRGYNKSFRGFQPRGRGFRGNWQPYNNNSGNRLDPSRLTYKTGSVISDFVHLNTNHES